LYDLSTPNANFLKDQSHSPLLERNPVRFWKIVSGALLAINVYLFYLLNI